MLERYACIKELIDDIQRPAEAHTTATYSDQRPLHGTG